MLSVRVLVTRPQPEAARTAARLTALGHQVVVAPLLATAAVAWELPGRLPDAVVFTSAAAVRLAGPQLACLRQLPVFVVGPATAAAARAAGFCATMTARDTAASLFDAVGSSGSGRVLYLAGRDRAVRALPPDVEVRETYAAALTPALPTGVLLTLASGEIDLTLLYSARTAQHFAALIDAAPIHRSQLGIAALSPAVLAAAGGGWAAMIAARSPDETALLTAAGLLQHPPVLQRPA